MTSSDWRKILVARCIYTRAMLDELYSMLDWRSPYYEEDLFQISRVSYNLRGMVRMLDQWDEQEAKPKGKAQPSANISIEDLGL